MSDDDDVPQFQKRLLEFLDDWRKKSRIEDDALGQEADAALNTAQTPILRGPKHSPTESASLGATAKCKTLPKPSSS